MLKYILRRILLVLPTLFVILVISFMVSRSVPGDPVFLAMDGQYRPGSNVDPAVRQQVYAGMSHKMGFDQPMFYVTFSSVAYPDTLYRIMQLTERSNLAEMVHRYGDWPEIEGYHESIKRLIVRCIGTPVKPEERAEILEVQVAAEELLTVAMPEEISYRLHWLDSLRLMSSLLQGTVGEQILEVQTKFVEVQAHSSRWKLYVPTLQFHGFQNQFHIWLTGILRGEFGKSYVDRRPVGDKIGEAMPWTIFMGFFSFAMAYLIAIPVGIYSVQNRNLWQDRTATILLFLLNSVPTFVMAMLTMTFLCNPEYLQIFPTSGINSDGAEQWPLGYRLLDYAYHLTLPTLLFSYHSIAFVSRQLRGGMLEASHADYIRTARAKGLPEGTVVWRHLLRNSLIPVITHLASLLPALVSGALITETIFSVPGMGQLTIQAISSYDHPAIIAVFTITAFATLIGLLMADVLYALVDPRISYDKK